MTDGSAVVLGLGNVLMSDEGVGVHAVRRLMDDPRLGDRAQLVDGGTLGLELLGVASGVDLLVVVDAVDVGVAPGSVVRFAGDELFDLDRGASVHQLGVADLLAALRLLGAEPARVVLLGVQPGHIQLGTELSPEVHRALDVLVDGVLAELVEPAMNEQAVSHA